MSSTENWQKYQNNNFIHRFFLHNFVENGLSLAESVRPSSVLDAGCGEGVLTRCLMHRLAASFVLGVDADATVISRGRALHPRVEFMLGSVTALPLESECVDLVVCTEVLEHLPTPQLALAELWRVARCHCLLSVPNEPFFQLANLFRARNLSSLGNVPSHIQHFGVLSFRRLVLKYFIPVATRYPFPWQMILCAKRRSVC